MNKNTLYVYQRVLLTLLLSITPKTSPMLMVYYPPQTLSSQSRDLTISEEALLSRPIQTNANELTLHTATLNNDLATIITLVNEYNVNVNALDPILDIGNTPLHWAAQKGSVEIGELLIKHNAEVNIQNKKGFTPLHCAIYSPLQKGIYTQNNIDFIDLLLKHNARQTIKNKDGHHPESYLINEHKGGSPISGIAVKKNSFIPTVHAILLCKRLEDLGRIIIPPIKKELNDK